MKDTHRLPLHISPQRYKIMLKPDLDNFTFEGEETIFLTLEKSTKEITIHCVEIQIDSAEWIHKTKEAWPARNASSTRNASRSDADRHSEAGGAGKVTYDKKTETATLKFAKSLEIGKGELRLKFKGILNDKMRGFYRSKYSHNGIDKHIVTTQFESTDARRAFPSFDEPSHKAIFDVTLMIPSHLTAISNTIESKISEHESGFKIVEFEPTPNMSTYLLAFIVGEFEYIESKWSGGGLVRVFTTPGKKEQAKFALDVAKKCMEFYENYFGIKYPLPVLDMIAIPDFAAGAMENWGAVTYRESTLLIDEEKSSAGNKQWVALVIAHELAHQWFGNLVTMQWWTHLWLNEGFASFIEYLAIDNIFPEWEIWTQFVSTDMANSYHLDSLQNTHPIEVEVKDAAEISEIFDQISYSKGATVLRMLWKYLGEKDFQKGLQHYLKKHQFSNASTKDLWESLSEVSGKNIKKIMSSWTSKPGHPLISVKCKVQSAKLELTQSRFFSSPISKKQSKDNTVWSIPLDGVLMDKKSMIIPDKREKLNLGETSLVRVDYPQNYLRELEEDIKTGKLSSADRIGLLRDSFDLAKSGNSPTTLALELTKSYINERDFTVWSEITSQLSQVDNLLALEQSSGDFQRYGREIYSEIAKKMGWDKKTGEKHSDSLLRGMVLNMLGGFGDDETISKAFELFNNSLSRHIDPDLRGVVYNLVCENGGEKEFKSIISMYKEEENQQEKDRLGRALGKFKSVAILKKVLDFALSKNVRFQNSLGIISSVWTNPKGRYLAWEFVKDNWSLLKERYAGGHYFTRVFSPAGDFTKISDAKDIEKFVKKNPVPEAKRTIAQALEQIYANSEWLKRDKQKIKKFLQSL